MRSLRRFTTCLLIAVAALLFLLFSLGAVLYSTALNTSFLKNVAESSGIYEDIIDNSVDLASVLADDMSVAFKGKERDVAQLLNNIRPNLKAVFTPTVIRDDTEKALDGLGGWLAGDTEAPDLAEATQDVTSQLTLALLYYMQDRLAILPLAPAGFSISGYDPFTAVYRLPTPPTTEELAERAAEITESVPVVNKVVFQGTDLLENPDDEPWSTIQHTYWWGRFALCFFAGLLGLTVVLALIFARNRSLVLKRIGHITLPTAVLLIIGSAVVGLFLANIDPQLLGDGQPAWSAFNEAIVHPLLHSFFTSLALVMLYFSLAYVFITTLCYIVASKLRRRRGSDHPQNDVVTQGWINTDNSTIPPDRSPLVKPPIDNSSQTQSPLN